MLLKANSLKGYKLDSLDGEIGKVEEFYFDDRHWAIRYLVANTGNWLTGRQVLISPYALSAVDQERKTIAIALTKKQIEASPSLSSDEPVSRQFEDIYYGYYGWPMYWGGSSVWGYSPYLVRDPEKWDKFTQGEDTRNPHLRSASDKGEKAWDPHLRSTYDVSGHRIQATDGEIGHVEDFIIDEKTWEIRYVVVGTRNWWPGKKVLVSPKWIERVSWSELKVFVNLSRETIKQSPEYTEESLITREYEAALHQHYNRPGYWIDEAADKMHAH